MQALNVDTIVTLIILMYSIIAHEVAHGYAAYMLGDDTAERAGRLTLNPIPHIDPIGSIALPILGFLSGSHALFGWAKPVPYNPYHLRPGRFSEAIVASAGVLTNFGIAAIFVVIVKIGLFLSILPDQFVGLAFEIILINLSLGIFNLLPLPPFDGMRIVTSLFPVKGRKILSFIDRYNFLFLIGSILLAVYAWGFIFPVIIFFFQKIF